MIDLASSLLPRLEANLAQPISAQIAAWQAHYGRHAPALLPRLCDDYAKVDGGWHLIAESRIFPHLTARLPAMKTVLVNLHQVCPRICERAATVLALTAAPVVVAYIGLGNGAGWATTWNGQPAVLLGLESIAELGWEHTAALEGLLAHEIGHLFMMQIRGDIESLGHDPLLALYEEGFAQHCEHLVTGRESWHCASQPGWLEWCRSHEADLAARYLDSLTQQENWRRFFGSWFNVDGRRQTGYYLGCRHVQYESLRSPLAGLVSWPEARIKESVAAFLQSLSNPDTQRRVEVVTHNPDWPRLFELEKSEIATAFGDEAVAIHHIGSTAIRNLCAKPIIDVLVEVRDIQKIDPFSETMAARGYQPKGEFGIAGRRFFIKGGDATRTHHIHLFQTGDPHVNRHLAFRDYLIAHPQDAQPYGQLKQSLAGEFTTDMDGYCAGKDAFIRQIDSKARGWCERSCDEQ